MLNLNEESLSEVEKSLLKKADTVGKIGGVNFLDIPVNRLKEFYLNETNKTIEEINNLFSQNKIAGDSILQKIELKAKATDVTARELNKWKVLIDTSLSFKYDTVSGEFLFWFGNITDDLVLATQLNLSFFDREDNHYFSNDRAANAAIKAINKDIVLVSLQFQDVVAPSRVVIKIKNRRMTNQHIKVSDIVMSAYDSD